GRGAPPVMARNAGYVLVAFGVGLIAWVGVTVWWGGPFTSLYTRHGQHGLSSRPQQLEPRRATRRPAARARPAPGRAAGRGHRARSLRRVRHIRGLRRGDRVSVRMRYGTFRYTVYYHRIVDSKDWSILRSRRFEKLVLSACHPLYSASHRWVVFARLHRDAGPA